MVTARQIAGKRVAHEIAHGAAYIAVTGDYCKGFVLCFEDGQFWVELEHQPGVLLALAKRGPDQFIATVAAGILFDLWATYDLDIARLPRSDLMKAVNLYFPVGPEDEEIEGPSDSFLLGYAMRFASLEQIKRGLEIGRAYAKLIAEIYLMNPALFEELAEALEAAGELGITTADFALALREPGAPLRVHRVARPPRSSAASVPLALPRISGAEGPRSAPGSGAGVG